MLALARSEPGIPIAPDKLDADPWALNVQNGTLDLRTAILRPHRREDLFTKIAQLFLTRPRTGRRGGIFHPAFSAGTKS